MRTERGQGQIVHGPVGHRRTWAFYPGKVRALEGGGRGAGPTRVLSGAPVGYGRENSLLLGMRVNSGTPVRRLAKQQRLSGLRTEH